MTKSMGRALKNGQMVHAMKAPVNMGERLDLASSPGLRELLMQEIL